ncbi:MAG: PepSY domain-containing protein, partial [bacterium]
MCIKRGLFLIHRSLGIVLCLMLALWFASGVVMMYVGYPELTPRERYARLAPLELDNGIISPAQAAASSSLTNPPLRVRLTMVLGRPAYHILSAAGPWITVFADDGSRLKGIRSEEIMASAQAFAPATAVSYEQRLDLDQWSVSSALDPFRPLHRVALGDNAGTELYVSNATGEVVRDTTRSERLWGWLGAIVHWVYPVQLRQHRELWRQVIIWLASIGLVLAATGASVGFMSYRFRKTYRSRELGTPYRGVLKWHHLTGLVFGAFAITWTFSGLLSVNPGNLFPDQVPDARDREIIAGGPFSLAVFNLPVAEALRFATRHITPKEAELVRLAGEPYYVFFESPDRSIVVSARGETPTVFTRFDKDQLTRVSAELISQHEITEAALLEDYDLYYYAHHQEVRRDGPAGRGLPHPIIHQVKDLLLKPEM